MLATLDHWTSGGTGLKGFFVFSDGVHLDAALRVLDTANLPAHAALLREGAALFGRDYGGTQARRHARWSDGRGGIRDDALTGTYVTVAMLLSMAEEGVPPGKEPPFKPDEP